MWLVDRHGSGQEKSRIALPSALSETLRSWYDGTGNDADEDASIVLVQQARRNAKWIACSCLGDNARPPLLTPAFLAIADTYYLRRLTGKGRANHRTDCPYFREQAPPRIRERLTSATHRNPADGYFEVLKPIPEHLAQAPTYTTPDDRTRGASIPRLARLMWELLATSRRNIILPVSATKGQGRRSIAHEFATIREAARRISVAPQIRLADVLFTHPDSFLEGKVFGRLRALERRWPGGHAPQAFLLLYTRAIRGNALFLAGGKTITTTSRVISPSTRASPIHGPFLSLVVVGKHPDDHAYTAIGAYAEPIHSGMRFIPIRSDQDRILIRGIDDARWKMHRQGINLQITVPLFDALIENEQVRPKLVVDAFDQHSGEMATLVFDDAGNDEVFGADERTRRHALLGKVGRVVPATPDLHDDITGILEEMLFNEMRGEKSSTATKEAQRRSDFASGLQPDTA
ncbi:MAG: hypothetical protein K2W86_18085 [Sphingomonas sp.]|uniref:hypothetical protein n=1 Tax=Sphingomonas sp. TaxID=28214 RepID=UPI0035A98DA7|nr:hypothetical protein [Sphingomonas sp.]